LYKNDEKLRCKSLRGDEGEYTHMLNSQKENNLQMQNRKCPWVRAMFQKLLA
jgi:hypothetical protein